MHKANGSIHEDFDEEAAKAAVDLSYEPITVGAQVGTSTVCTRALTNPLGCEHYIHLPQFQGPVPR